MATKILNTDSVHEFKYTTTGNVTSGSLLVIGKIVGIALESATTGAVISVMCGCECTVTKKAAASSNVTVGGWIGYTATGGVNAVRGTTATGDDIIGYGVAVAATGATSATIRLRSGPFFRAG